MILHLLRMRRNINLNVFNDRKNVSATTALYTRDQRSPLDHHVTLVSSWTDELSPGDLYSMTTASSSRSLLWLTKVLYFFVYICVVHLISAPGQRTDSAPGGDLYYRVSHMSWGGTYERRRKPVYDILYEEARSMKTGTHDATMDVFFECDNWPVHYQSVLASYTHPISNAMRLL